MLDKNQAYKGAGYLLQSFISQKKIKGFSLLSLTRCILRYKNVFSSFVSYEIIDTISYTLHKVHESWLYLDEGKI